VIHPVGVREPDSGGVGTIFELDDHLCGIDFEYGCQYVCVSLASVVVDDSRTRCEFSVRDGEFHGVSMTIFGKGSMLCGSGNQLGNPERRRGRRGGFAAGEGRWKMGETGREGPRMSRMGAEGRFLDRILRLDKMRGAA
jgi:hypothetical protein